MDGYIPHIYGLSRFFYHMDVTVSDKCPHYHASFTRRLDAGVMYMYTIIKGCFFIPPLGQREVTRAIVNQSFIVWRVFTPK